MGRIVRAAVKPGPQFYNAPFDAEANAGVAARARSGTNGDKDGTKEGDGYLQRVAKYIPAEILGFFLFVNNILQEAAKSGADAAATAGAAATMAGGDIKVQTVATLVFLLAWCLTPVYIWAMRDGATGEAWKLNAIIAALAFPVWAYAMNAVIFSGIHDGHLASILLATFTVCSGLIVPSPADPNEPEPQPAS